MERSTASRLQSKTAEESIIGRLAEDLHLAPFLARAYYDQISEYFAQYGGQTLQANQVAYCALAAEAPAGQPLGQAPRVPIRLTLHATEDLEVAEGEGLAALRRQRIVRLCEEAQQQGALLTHEDLALLLTTSLSTIYRDLKRLRTEGTLVPTRGQQRDIGPGVSHKTTIVRRYLLGEGLSDLGRRLPHGIASMERYLQAFRQVALMTREKLASSLIAQAARLSPRLVREYQELYDQARAAPTMQARLEDLLATPKKGGR